MKALTKILRVIAVVLSAGALLGYYLVTADIPPVAELNDLYILMVAYTAAVIAAITDFTVCVRYNCRGGYFTLCLEAIILILWILSYRGVNFHINDNGADAVARNILIGGIITGAIQTLTQLMCLVISKARGITGKEFQ